MSRAVEAITAAAERRVAEKILDGFEAASPEHILGKPVREVEDA